MSNENHPVAFLAASSYISCPNVDDPQAFAARVSGHSMRPKYRNGDIVIFSPASPARSGDDCYVRYANGQSTFKRVYYEGEQVRLQPRNEACAAVSVPLASIGGIYRAVFLYRRVNARTDG